MSHISTLQLSEMAGITKRHCQRLLVTGHVPDAVRTDGGHWSIPDNAKLRKWIAKQKNAKHTRKVPSVYSVPAMPTAEINCSKLPALNKIHNSRANLKTTHVVTQDEIALKEIHKCRENLKKSQAVMQEVIDSTRANAYAAGARLIVAYDKNPGGAWLPWLAKNGIDRSEANELMNFARYCDTGDNYADSLMLKKFGVIKSKPRAASAKLSNIAAPWITRNGKVVGHFRQLTRSMPISQWQDSEKEAVAAQLKPIADLYQKLSR